MLKKIIELFTQKIVTKLSKIWVWDPRSGKNPFRIPGSKRHRIPDPQYWWKDDSDTGNGTVRQCWGSRYACFWNSLIRIHMFLDLLDPDPSKAKIVRKNLIRIQIRTKLSRINNTALPAYEDDITVFLAPLARNSRQHLLDMILLAAQPGGRNSCAGAAQARDQLCRSRRDPRHQYRHTA
jgi:hypothetical protein